MQIEPNVYLVGSGRAGFDLTDPFDCNIYLFDSGAGYVLFDAGTGMERIRSLRSAGMTALRWNALSTSF
ncbi:MAG: hypothetical protein R3E79_12910 [Caldilineaceae bacterium]